MSDLISRLDQLPFELFYKIWELTQVYDYDEICNIVCKNRSLVTKIDCSLLRIDFNSSHSQSFIERRLLTLQENCPSLREVNLINVNIEYIKFITQYPIIKNCVNVHIDTVDKNTSKTILELILDHKKKYGSEFTFDIRSKLPETGVDELEDIDCCQDIEYQICYSEGKFTSRNHSKCGSSYILTSYIHKLRPHTIVSYGNEYHWPDLLKYDYVQNLEFRYRSKSHIEDHVIIPHLLLYNNINKQPSGIAVIDGRRFRVLDNTSIKEIRCDHHNKVEELFFVGGVRACIFPTITVMEVPILLGSDIEHVINAFPNTHKFYLSSNKSLDLSLSDCYYNSLKNRYPNKEFILLDK